MKRGRIGWCLVLALTTFSVTTAAQAARFVREVNHPSLRMMYDSFHAHIEEKDPAAAIRRAGSPCPLRPRAYSVLIRL